MADQQVTAALSDLSLSPPGLPNFPLPRELRDHIYSYLLDGQHVRIKRMWSRTEYEDNFNDNRTGPRAYHFHTNILGVNRAIHDEAEELLYKRNMFVVFSYEWFGLGHENGGLLWLPIMSNKYVPRMKSHAVRIHVSPGTAGHRDPMVRGNASMQAAIFLVRDLDASCLIMTTAGSSCMQTNLSVTLHKGVGGVPTMGLPGVFNAANRAAPQFKCELENTRFRQIDAATRRQILAPMAHILAPSQRVSFKGTVCDSREVELSKQTISPTLNCFPAYKWAVFRALSLAKDMADAALPHDDLKLVMSLYAIAAVTVAVCTFTHTEAPAQRQTFLLASPEAAEACDILYLEAMVNAACCAVKTGDSNVLLEAGEGIQRCMSRREAQYVHWASVPPQLEAYCNSVLLWRGRYSGIQCKMPTVGEMVRLWTGPNGERHQKHDREVLLRQPDQEAEMSRKHLPLEQCSAFQLPLPSIACHKAFLEQHEGRSKGWLDMDLLRSLPENLKRQVNRQQKQYKIKVTALDELDL